jgi:hypothetical protein
MCYFEASSDFGQDWVDVGSPEIPTSLLVPLQVFGHEEGVWVDVGSPEIPTSLLVPLQVFGHEEGVWVDVGSPEILISSNNTF